MLTRRCILERFCGNLLKYSFFIKMDKQFSRMVNEFDTYRGLLKAAKRCVDTNYEQPIVFILGSTGVGKTQLSIELAKRFSGEIISADSMQVYQGMNIATNKATKEERYGIMHHCFDYIDPYQQHTVIDFRRDATDAINDIISRGKLPIVVGGTNYYIECLLFSVGVDKDPKNNEYFTTNITSNNNSENFDPPKTLEELFSKPILKKYAEKWPKELLHKFLVECDPILAEKTSPQNIRKIIRFLQIIQSKERPASDIYRQQKESPDSDGKPVYTNSVIFWLDCDREILNQRLDERCDKMIKNGLLEELLEFHARHNAERVLPGMKPNYTEGIFQTIGLKEFHKWLICDEEYRNSYDGTLVLGHCIIDFKTRTKSYVPRQLKWINKRFLTYNKHRLLPNIYRLDTSKPELWSENVLEKAIKIFQIKLEMIVNIYPKQYNKLNNLLNNYAEKVYRDDNCEYNSGQFYCDVCKIHVSGGKSYEMHLKSKNHRFNLKQINSPEQQQQQKQQI